MFRPSATSTELASSAYQSLIALQEQLARTKKMIVEVEGTKIILAPSKVGDNKTNFIASGSFKSLYDVGGDKVLAILNIATTPNPTLANRWCEAVIEEVQMATLLKRIGLHTQDYGLVRLKIGAFYLPALLMTNFVNLSQQGLQVRDSKNKKHYGTSFLFGHKANLINPEHYEILFKDILSDIIQLLIYDIHFPQALDSLILVLRIQFTLNSITHKNGIYFLRVHKTFGYFFMIFQTNLFAFQYH